MKVLLHSDKLKEIEKSGVGRAIKHQMKALELVNVDYTTNPKEDYDIIHINTIFPESYLMGLKAKRKGKKVIFHAHSTEEDFKNSFIMSNQVAPLFKVWLQQCYSSADLVLTPTPYSKALLDEYGLGKPVISISNGIELDFFYKDESLKEAFRKEYNFKKTDKIIMAVGLYIERKGIIDFVKLAKKMPEYKFIWFGYTNLKTVPPKIREAVETKLPNLFFPGYVSRDILKGAYSTCDLFIFPTFEETEGIVLLEALATKIPVLIRDIPIYEGWLTDSVNVYKAKDVNEFEVKIKSIIKGDLKDLTEEGYEVAKERDIKNIGLELKKIYENLMEIKVD
jgi:1,2-diacylglycerol-3-alpha-glucose alpha-1,2-glucosyltransferase